jgi:hypothetical protein
MPNYEFIKSSYSVPQNGTFENFSVLHNGVKILEWSDNCGIVIMDNDIENLHPEIYPILEKMTAASKAADVIWEHKNGGYNEHETVYARDGRTDEFGVNWNQL